MHRYPLIGRFAAQARKRPYLWSFSSVHVRPALYAGAVLAVLPLVGVQMVLALGLALLFRANFMVMAALQLITNPFTAVPVYYITYKLGRFIMITLGFGGPAEVMEVFDVPPETVGHLPEMAADEGWTPTVGTRINALFIGGLVGGLALGLFFDLLWQLSSGRIGRRRISRT